MADLGCGRVEKVRAVNGLILAGHSLSSVHLPESTVEAPGWRLRIVTEGAP